MSRDFLNSMIFHILILGILAIPVGRAVKREIVPSHPIPVIFEKIEKDIVPSRKKVAPKHNTKKPKAKTKAKVAPPKQQAKKEIKKNVVKIPTEPKPVKEIKKDFLSVLENIATPEEKSEPVTDFENILKDLTPDEYKHTAEEVSDDIPESILDMLKDNFSITEEDALRAQISNNWLVPVGSKDIEKMIVDIRIKVAKGGKVTSVKEIKNKYYQKKNTAYDIFVQSAKRAILKSSPLELSDERMKIENDIIFHFAPTDMF